MGVGLGLGLLVAVLVYVKDHRAAPAEAAPSKKSTTREPGEAAKGKPDAADDPTAAHYDFYDKLLKDEVIPPEKGQAVRSLPPMAKISQPGTYVLQGGVFRQTDDAERMRAKLAKLGITATVQRISVDDDVWHRIRIGPINNLEQLNHVLDQLHRADIDPIVTRAGD
jgi:cell division protein FtsN